MFTGIVREVGRVTAVEGGAAGVRLQIDAPATAAASVIGDSVSVNGCCLTAVALADGQIAFDLVPETLSRTSLGRLEPGARVNVEGSLHAGDSLGGHYVQGHVDGLGRVRSIEPEGGGRRLTIDAPVELLRYVVVKGSIAVEGTSLTVAAVEGDSFEVALIPHTLAETTLGDLAAGDTVNLEADVLAKYVERLLHR